MFQPIYPTPHTGAHLRAKDALGWFGARNAKGVSGDESRLERCRFCGWICDPDIVQEARDGSFVGKGVSYGSQQSSTLTLNKGRATETIYYYEPADSGGCPNCHSLLWRGGK